MYLKSYHRFKTRKSKLAEGPSRRRVISHDEGFCMLAGYKGVYPRRDGGRPGSVEGNMVLV